MVLNGSAAGAQRRQDGASGAIAIGGPWNEFRRCQRPGVLRGGAHRLTPAVWDVFRAVVETLISWWHRLELCGPQ